MTTTTANTTNEAINNPFVKPPAEGDDTTISAEDIMKLLESLKLDTTGDAQLQDLLERAKNGEGIEREVVMNAVTSLLSADSENLGELTGSIGNFELELR